MVIQIINIHSNNSGSQKLRVTLYFLETAVKADYGIISLMYEQRPLCRLSLLKWKIQGLC